MLAIADQSLLDELLEIQERRKCVGAEAAIIIMPHTDTRPRPSIVSATVQAC